MKTFKTFYFTVDIYVSAKSLESAQNKIDARLKKIADKDQMEPYIINDCGDCES